jgi:asparagine synthase (glutamine-hydrolysing)
MTIADGRNRAVARNAFADLLPPEVLHRRSKGTFMSYSGAVYQRNKVQLREFLLSGALQQHQLLDVAALQQFFKADLPPRDNSFMRVLELSMIENWVRHQV